MLRLEITKNSDYVPWKLTDLKRERNVYIFMLEAVTKYKINRKTIYTKGKINFTTQTCKEMDVH